MSHQNKECLKLYGSLCINCFPYQPISRIIKFRQLFHCQNGHSRWAYFHFPTLKEQLKTINDELILEWGERNCECPTWDLGEGYHPIKEHQEFLNLLDKNKKEIYEGDILKNKEGMIGIVEFDHASFIARLRPARDVDNWCYNGHVFYLTEVIGNIYENLELIKI